MTPVLLIFLRVA